MGAKCAPVFANLYMGAFESLCIFDNSTFYLSIKFYRGYIDDLYLIWQGSEVALQDFIGHLNYNDWGLNFTGHTDKSHIDFLDLNIFIDKGKIHTKTFFKTVDAHSLLDFGSNHLKCWKTNMPYGQIVRMRRNCTNREDKCVWLAINWKIKNIQKKL